MARDLSSKLRDLRRAGWTTSITNGGHVKATHPQARSVVFTGSTPSDHRAIKNFEAQLRRALPDPLGRDSQPAGTLPSPSPRKNATGAVRREAFDFERVVFRPAPPGPLRRRWSRATTPDEHANPAPVSGAGDATAAGLRDRRDPSQGRQSPLGGGSRSFAAMLAEEHGAASPLSSRTGPVRALPAKRVPDPSR